MGLFSKNGICSICGSSNGDKKIADGFVCKNCREKSRLIVLNWKEITSDRIRKCIKATEESEDRTKIFLPDRKVEKYLYIDYPHRLWQIPAYRTVFSFDDLVSYEIIENGDTVSKGGLGSAIVGGALFGGVGAVVGGITGGKEKQKHYKGFEDKIYYSESYLS